MRRGVQMALFIDLVGVCSVPDLAVIVFAHEQRVHKRESWRRWVPPTPLSVLPNHKPPELNFPKGILVYCRALGCSRLRRPGLVPPRGSVYLSCLGRRTGSSDACCLVKETHGVNSTQRSTTRPCCAQGRWVRYRFSGSYCSERLTASATVTR